MSDGSAAELAMQAEQRHQIHYCQRLGGNLFEVRQVCRIQSSRGEQVGEQLLMKSGAMPSAVFIEFDCDERCFRLTTKTGDRPGVRVPFLEMIQRSMHEVFAHLL